MTINMIVAMNPDGIIGVNNDIPWRVKEDMIHFKEKTIGQIVLMGRKTWESLPPKQRPLKDRFNIIISKNNCQSNDIAKNVFWFNDFMYGIDYAKSVSEVLNKEIWIIGGAQIYEMALPVVTDIHLTMVNKPIPEGHKTILNIDISKFSSHYSRMLTEDAEYKWLKRIK